MTTCTLGSLRDTQILDGLDNEEEKTAKLALVLAAKTAIKNGLALLGMDAPERM